MAYFLDLFIGDPSTTGVSILATITGSATRTDISAIMQETFYPDAMLTNPVNIVVTTASRATTNISWVGIYSAASGGSLLFSAPIGASPTINKGNPVRFNALDLSFGVFVFMITESGSGMITDPSDVPMVTEALQV